MVPTRGSMREGLRAVEGRRECAFPAHRDLGKFKYQRSARVSLLAGI